MNKNARRKANKDQINMFISAYYSEWRFIQILSIQKKIKNKYEFYQDIIDTLKETDNLANEGTIAQEITNGLLFDAIQNCIQYIEDLFAFINASSNRDFFIRSMIKYNAGKIENLITSFKYTKNNICESYHFPFYSEKVIQTEKEKETLKVIYEGIERLGLITTEIAEFYKEHKFFYNQYKHGLSIALRPFNDFSKEQIELDKIGKSQKSRIIALDNLNFKNASKNHYNYSGHFFIPAFTENIRPHLMTLQNENNLLRYVYSPEDITIERLVEISAKTKRCLQILIHNFRSTINDEDLFKLRLPANNPTEVTEFQIEII